MNPNIPLNSAAPASAPAVPNSRAQAILEWHDAQDKSVEDRRAVVRKYAAHPECDLRRIYSEAAALVL